jgi:hypothetical protein
MSGTVVNRCSRDQCQTEKPEHNACFVGENRPAVGIRYSHVRDQHAATDRRGELGDHDDDQRQLPGCGKPVGGVLGTPAEVHRKQRAECDDEQAGDADGDDLYGRVAGHGLAFRGHDGTSTRCSDGHSACCL